MFKFITHRGLLLNLLVALLVGVGLILVALYSLNYFTDHDKVKKVPSTIGKKTEDAIKLIESNGFTVEVLDSLYLEAQPKNTVLKQSPEPDAVVKNGRTIYLTINRTQPPIVEFPNMVGFSKRNAIMYLNTLGLKMGDTTFKPDIAKDAVLEQWYKGQPLKPGTKLFMGSTIDFVLGAGLGDKEMVVPDLAGMTYGEAKSYLNSRNINIGSTPSIGGKITDTANAYIAKQDPEPTSFMNDGSVVSNFIRPGQLITLWLSAKKISRSGVDSVLGIKRPTADDFKKKDDKSDKENKDNL
jgi:eukaryotic-like serine/threonine-protein kinase